MGDKAVSVCYDREEHVDGQLEAASHLQALVLMGHFDHPDIHRRGNKEGHKQPGRFLDNTGDKFLTQVIEE